MTQDRGDAKDSRPAPTIWAQRNDTLFITFKVEDCKNTEVIFKPETIEFSGKTSRGPGDYSNLLTLFDEIKPEGCSWSRKGFGVECKIQKKKGGFWKRLLKDTAKAHWLKVDFQRWKDEDESTDDEEDGGQEPDLSQMMAQMGGGGMPNMMDMDDEEEEDSDDEDIPDLEENPVKEEASADA